MALGYEPEGREFVPGAAAGINVSHKFEDIVTEIKGDEPE
jgi:hypothetical protein